MERGRLVGWVLTPQPLQTAEYQASSCSWSPWARAPCKKELAEQYRLCKVTKKEQECD